MHFPFEDSDEHTYTHNYTYTYTYTCKAAVLQQLWPGVPSDATNNSSHHLNYGICIAFIFV